MGRESIGVWITLKYDDERCKGRRMVLGRQDGRTCIVLIGWSGI